MEENRETVGKISSDLLQKANGPVTVIDQQREMQKDYLDNLVQCVEKNKKDFPGDFFVVVETKTEPLMPNVMRNYFFARWTCPTPTYDQSIFKYNKKDERIEYLWTLPSRDACYHIKNNLDTLSNEEQQLAFFVVSLFDGSLLRKAKELNHEYHNSLELEK